MEALFNSSVIQVIKAVIDIVCVAYIFYFSYKLFEDTNSITIIKGFIVIAVIYFVANFLDLKALAWIFKYVVSYFVILVVVLFQPEIRKVLSRIGQSGWSGITGKVTQESVNEITRAAMQMSEQKMGGLIIIEEKVGLRQLLDESIQMDAQVQSELLLSIFYKGSILHDGAVLIKGDRIIAARVIIPSVIIEAFIKAKSGLGTRHRAGIAVTADSDAVSFIISEETGALSIAHKGRLEQDLSFEKFLRRTNEILGLE